MAKIKVLILTARPAAGKSEVIDFLKKIPPKRRAALFGIGAFEELDDFPYVWETFENDAIWERLGRPRQNTDGKLYFKDDAIWDFFIHKLNLAYEKKLARDPRYHKKQTTIVEFARGGENGIGRALGHLSDAILDRAAILYIDVSYEESVRKNRRRFRPELADSILYHSLPDEKMERYYKVNDWQALSKGEPDGFVEVRGRRVPFAVLKNEPEVTDDPKKLGPALREALARLRKRLGSR
jgi:hypothetical protein